MNKELKLFFLPLKQRVKKNKKLTFINSESKENFIFTVKNFNYD